mmetsp:Transcript_131636/g.262702  ORF Transcript_131636/g.262702 Transcript_131636/m.262702 type:complete len:221 (+) Transcript_131636:103-765(+)
MQQYSSSSSWGQDGQGDTARTGGFLTSAGSTSMTQPLSMRARVPQAELGDDLTDEPSLFNDAHGMLKSLAAEIAALRRHGVNCERERCMEIQELRDLLEKQRAERKDTVSRLRYEFEEFVHKKIDMLMKHIRDMKQSEGADDAKQQAQIDLIDSNLEKLKKNMFHVQNSWGKLISAYINPEGTFDAEEALRQHMVYAMEDEHGGHLKNLGRLSSGRGLQR